MKTILAADLLLNEQTKIMFAESRVRHRIIKKQQHFIKYLPLHLLDLPDFESAPTVNKIQI